MSDCIHHWIIDTPNGPKSKGECKKCKATMQFCNSDTSPKRPRRNPKTKAVVYTDDILITPSQNTGWWPKN